MKAYIFVRELDGEVPGKVLGGISVANDVGTHFSRVYEQQTFPFTKFGEAVERATIRLDSAYGKNVMGHTFFVGNELRHLEHVERFLAHAGHPWPFKIDDHRASEYMREAGAA